LSLGYWRRPDLTRAKFVPDPVGGPERLYLTGDLGRWAPDGALMLLGRKDFQAKVRGHRVEIAAVEAALVRHEGVGEAAVLARGDRLIAYVTPGRQPLPTAGELRRALGQSLPNYMVPTTFVTLDALSVTPFGKIDRAALPDPGRRRPATLPPPLAPRTPVETIVAGIWADVLELDVVGVHDDFLDLGGHSLSAAQIAQRVLQSLQVDVSVSVLIEAPTVAGMALVVVAHCAKTLGADAVARFLDGEENAPSRTEG
jgi:hypothetical protein